MTPDPDTAESHDTVDDFLHRVVLVRRHSAFPLVGPGGDVEGMVTLNRIRGLRPDERAHKRLEEIACPPGEVPFAQPDDRLTDLLPRLGGCADGRALVMDDGRLVGIVSPSDVNRALTLHRRGRRAGEPLTGCPSDPRQRDASEDDDALFTSMRMSSSLVWRFSVSREDDHGPDVPGTWRHRRLRRLLSQ